MTTLFDNKTTGKTDSEVLFPTMFPKPEKKIESQQCVFSPWLLVQTKNSHNCVLVKYSIFLIWQTHSSQFLAIKIILVIREVSNQMCICKPIVSWGPKSTNCMITASTVWISFVRSDYQSSPVQLQRSSLSGWFLLPSAGRAPEEDQVLGITLSLAVDRSGALRSPLTTVNHMSTVLADRLHHPCTAHGDWSSCSNNWKTSQVKHSLF